MDCCACGCAWHVAWVHKNIPKWLSKGRGIYQSRSGRMSVWDTNVLGKLLCNLKLTKVIDVFELLMKGLLPLEDYWQIYCKQQSPGLHRLLAQLLSLCPWCVIHAAAFSLGKAFHLKATTFFFFFFEEFHVPQADLEHLILLSPPPKNLNFQPLPPYPAKS